MLAALILLLSEQVGAALISVDLNNVNDGFITKDTSTNLEWLDFFYLKLN